MKDYVFVHGSYHGAWCWDSVKNDLESQGFNVFTTDLPGHGNDNSDRKQITIEKYVTHVVNYIVEMDLRNIILVGHSMGGIVVSLVAERIPERISHLVFLGGLILDNGERFIDLIPEWRRKIYMDIGRKKGEIPVNPEFVKNCFLNTTDESTVKKVLSKLNPQPYIHENPVFLKNFKDLPMPIIYIRCKQDKSMTETYFQDVLKRLPSGYQLTEIDSDHEPMFSNPKELSKIFSEIK